MTHALTDALLRLVHLVAVVYWIGGIFFVQIALRPALALLEPAPRLRLMAAVMRRYFQGVGLSIALVLVSGGGMWGLMASGGGWWAVHWHVYAMLGLATVMVTIYGHTVGAPLRRLTLAVAAQDWPAGAAALAQIRRQALTNLLLGLATMAVALVGRVL